MKRATCWLLAFMTSAIAAAPVEARDPARDFRFASGRSALCIPFDPAGRQISLQARVNGHDSVWLALDTGSSGSVLDGKRAASLGLEAAGVQTSLGAGGAQEGSIVRGVNVGLPGFELLNLTMDTLPLEGLSAQTGHPFDGILGHQVFTRCAVEIDYARHCLSLFDAEGYEYGGKGSVVPIELIDNHPYVTATVALPGGKTIHGRFVIDTGSSGGLILSPDTVEREGIAAVMGKMLSTKGLGVGGPSDVRMGRVERLELGGFQLARPIAVLQPAGAGRVSAAGTLGNIGGGILSRFKVIFDYPSRRMILEPGPDMSDPFEVDMSGLNLVSTPPDFRTVRVMRVMEGSPASEAGVRAGDEVVSVDGKPAGEIGIPALRERLRREGEEVHVVLRRGTEQISIALRARRMI